MYCRIVEWVLVDSKGTEVNYERLWRIENKRTKGRRSRSHTRNLTLCELAVADQKIFHIMK